MMNMSPINVDKGVSATIRDVTRSTNTVTVEYVGYDGQVRSITVPDSMNDTAIRWSIRHAEWMRMYPSDV